MYLAALIAVAGAAQELVPVDYRLPPRREADSECRPGPGSDVVVCGRRPTESYRVSQLPERAPDALMRPYQLGGGVTATPEISQTYYESGAWAGMVDRRVTVRVRVPF